MLWVFVVQTRKKYQARFVENGGATQDSGPGERREVGNGKQQGPVTPAMILVLKEGIIMKVWSVAYVADVKTPIEDYFNALLPRDEGDCWREPPKRTHALFSIAVLFFVCLSSAD